MIQPHKAGPSTTPHELPAAPVDQVVFAQIQQAMRRGLAARLPMLCGILSVLSGVHGALIHFTDPSISTESADIFAAACCAGLALAGVILRFVKTPPVLANPAAAMVFGVGLVQTLLSQYQLASPGRTTLIMLIVTGGGSFLLSRPWFAVVAGLGFAGWVFNAVEVGTPQEWGGYGLTLLLAIGIGAVVQHNRLVSAHQFFKYKLEREASERLLNKAISEAQAGSERFQMFSEATLDGILRLNQGMITDANKAAGKMFGMPSEDLLGRNVIDLIAPEHRMSAKDALSMATLRPVETVGLRKDTSTFPVEIVNRAVDSGKERTHLLVFRNNAARHELDLDRKKHQSSLETQNKRLAGLARLSTLPMEGDALAGYLDECMELLATCLPADAGCALIMWDASIGEFVAAAERVNGPVNPPGQSSLDFGRDAVSWVCANNEALIVGMIGDDSLGVRKIFPGTSIQAYAAIPVRNTEGTFGVLFALQSQPRDWSRDDSHFIQTVARLAGNATVNSALARQVRSLAEAGLSPEPA